MSNSRMKEVKPSDNVHKDRLSSLPDCVILHILSFLIAKHAIGTCVLSSRWKDLWKRVPAFTFDSADFPTFRTFNTFVTKVLSLRDSSVSLHTLNFKTITFRVESPILRWIVDYSITHDVQQLGLRVSTAIAQIPLTLFSSQILTHLTLSISHHDGKEISLNLPSLTYLVLSVYSGHGNLFPKSLNLPVLTSLVLKNFTFCAGDNDCPEPFSTFNRLNNLLISSCTVKGAGTLRISSPTLVNFTMYNDSDKYYKIDLCTPSLCTFAFRGIPYQDISGSNISSLKHVDIDAEIFIFSRGPPLFLFNWLSEFGNIKSLTVTASTLQILSLTPGLLNFKIPSLGKLKLLKVKIDEIQEALRLTLCEKMLLNLKSEREAARIQKALDLGLELYPLVPDGIVDFLLQNSPSAEVDLVDCRKETA